MKGQETDTEPALEPYPDEPLIGHLRASIRHAARVLAVLMVVGDSLFQLTFRADLILATGISLLRNHNYSSLDYLKTISWNWIFRIKKRIHQQICIKKHFLTLVDMKLEVQYECIK